MEIANRIGYINFIYVCKKRIGVPTDKKITANALFKDKYFSVGRLGGMLLPSFCPRHVTRLLCVLASIKTRCLNIYLDQRQSATVFVIDRMCLLRCLLWENR